MSVEKTRAAAERLVELCRAGKAETCLDELYRDDAVSVEAGPMPGAEDPVTSGLAGIRGKHAWWNENFEEHSTDIEGPFLHGDDRFGVAFSVDATHKPSGERSAMRELAVYHVDENGRIFREEFFYPSAEIAG